MTKRDQILQALSNADRPLSTNQVATETGLDWHSVDDRLHDLADEGRVVKRELSNRLTLWWDREIPL